MRIFVCEYVTGGGFAGTALPEGLLREADAMLAALVKDLAAIPGVAVALPRDARLPDPALPARVLPIAGDADVWALWRRGVAEADALWPLAPETDGALERLSRLALDAGKELLGSRPEALRLTARKHETAAFLSARGVPVVPGVLAPVIPSGGEAWVVKPDDGAGCEDTRLFRRRDRLEAWLRQNSHGQGYLVQPYLPGTAASLSLLCQDGAAWLLSCNRQQVTIEQGRFRYRGGITGGLEARRHAFAPIARQIAAAIPALWGYLGVDLVDIAEGPVVLEINPRLTTSYVGLGRAIGVNPAALVLGLLDRPLAALRSPLKPRAVPVELETALV